MLAGALTCSNVCMLLAVAYSVPYQLRWGNIFIFLFKTTDEPNLQHIHQMFCFTLWSINFRTNSTIFLQPVLKIKAKKGIRYLNHFFKNIRGDCKNLVGKIRLPFSLPHILTHLSTKYPWVLGKWGIKKWPRLSGHPVPAYSVFGINYTLHPFTLRAKTLLVVSANFNDSHTETSLASVVCFNTYGIHN